MRCEFAVLLIACVVLGACDKEPAKEPPEAATTNSAAPPAEPEAPTEPAKVPAGAGFADFGDADWCPRAHDDTVKIVEGMKQTMKLAGKDAGADDYAPPARAEYLELCGKLPLEMQRCLVVGYAMKNRDGCQTALDGLDDAAKATYSELMGK